MPFEQNKKLEFDYKNHDPYAVKKVVAQADFGEGYYDYDVVQADDYEKLLRLYELLNEG